MEIFNSYRYRGGVKRKARTRHVNFKAICIAILFEFLRRDESLGERFKQSQSLREWERETDASEVGKESRKRLSKQRQEHCQGNDSCRTSRKNEQKTSGG